MRTRIDYYTIEPDKDGDGWWLIAHGEYGSDSVLEGESLWQRCGLFASIEEAMEIQPEAEVLEHSSKIDWFTMSQVPPEWFDEQNAGERWEEDY